MTIKSDANIGAHKTIKDVEQQEAEANIFSSMEKRKVLGKFTACTMSLIMNDFNLLWFLLNFIKSILNLKCWPEFFKENPETSGTSIWRGFLFPRYYYCFDSPFISILC